MMKKFVLLSALGALSVSSFAFASPVTINPPTQISCSANGQCEWKSENKLWQTAILANSIVPARQATYYFVGAEYLLDIQGSPLADSAIYRRKDANGNMVGSDFLALGLINNVTLIPGLNQVGSLWAKSKTDRAGYTCGWVGYSSQEQAANLNQCQWDIK